MYDKIISSTKISVEEHEEVIIRPKGNNIEKVLSYRDEGNVSEKLNIVICIFTDVMIILDEHCCQSLCTRKRREECYSI